MVRGSQRSNRDQQSSREASNGKRLETRARQSDSTSDTSGIYERAETTMGGSPIETERRIRRMERDSDPGYRLGGVHPSSLSGGLCNGHSSFVNFSCRYYDVLNKSGIRATHVIPKRETRAPVCLENLILLFTHHSLSWPSILAQGLGE